MNREERLKEIDSWWNLRLKHTYAGPNTEWLISELKKAWDKIEVYEECLKFYSKIGTLEFILCEKRGADEDIETDLGRWANKALQKAKEIDNGNKDRQ